MPEHDERPGEILALLREILSGGDGDSVLSLGGPERWLDRLDQPARQRS